TAATSRAPFAYAYATALASAAGYVSRPLCTGSRTPPRPRLINRAPALAAESEFDAPRARVRGPANCGRLRFEWDRAVRLHHLCDEELRGIRHADDPLTVEVRCDLA